MNDPNAMRAADTPPPACSTIHGFDGAWAHGLNRRSVHFSYGVFPLVRTKDGQRWKRGKVIVRVWGNSSNADAVKAEAKRICDALDAGTYTGPKRVMVPWSNEKAHFSEVSNSERRIK